MRYFRRITRYDYWNLKNIAHVLSIIKAVKEDYKVHQLVVV